MRFHKLHALGNDFVVVESRDVDFDGSLGDLAITICDRHYGAGADGLIVAERVGAPGGPDWTSRIFNADGSEAEVSGNGTRCLAAYVDVSGSPDANRDGLDIATIAGTKRVRFLERRDRWRFIEMDMGVPLLRSREVPFVADPPLERMVDYPLGVDGMIVECTIVSVGNPHCSIFGGHHSRLDVLALGPAIERHPRFPNRTNVEFIEVVNRGRMNVQFWERGVGETLSSGTGSTAAAVAGVLSGRTDSDLTVATPAGDLRVSWPSPDASVKLAGPAELVYSAEWLRR